MILLWKFKFIYKISEFFMKYHILVYLNVKTFVDMVNYISTLLFPDEFSFYQDAV